MSIVNVATPRAVGNTRHLGQDRLLYIIPKKSEENGQERKVLSAFDNHHISFVRPPTLTYAV